MKPSQLRLQNKFSTQSRDAKVFTLDELWYLNAKIDASVEAANVHLLVHAEILDCLPLFLYRYSVIKRV